MLYVLERRLQTKFGHFAPQINALMVNLHCTQKISLLCSAGIKTTNYSGNFFVSDILQPITLKNEIHSLLTDVENISSLLTRSKNVKDDHIFIPSARYYELKLALLLCSVPNLKLTIHIRLLAREPIEKLSLEDKNNLNFLIKSSKIKILTETDELNNFLTSKMEIPCEKTITLPCLIHGENKSELITEIANKVTVGFLGQSRTEKGFRRIIKIYYYLNRITKLRNINKNITIVFQRPKKLRVKDFIFNIIPMYILRSFGWPDFSILNAEITDDETISNLKNCSIIALPYLQPEYYARGSGFLLDGVMNDKYIVYSEGMGFGKYTQFGNGICCTNNRDFAEAIISLIHEDQDRIVLDKAKRLLKEDFSDAFRYISNLR